VNCPGNPGAWKRHAPVHKEVRRQRKNNEDGGEWQQRERETAERAARYAAQSGDEYDELLAKGARYASKEDPRREAKAYREAIALRPDKPDAYYNLGLALARSAHYVEAAQRFLEARERYPVGSVEWALAAANAFGLLIRQECAGVAKPEWWNDEGLKALSARVVRAVPDDVGCNMMRAHVLRAGHMAWEWGTRSAAELRKAATHWERAAALEPAPTKKAVFAGAADECRSQAEAM